MTPLRVHADPLDDEPAAQAAPEIAEAAPRRYFRRRNRPATPESLTVSVSHAAAMLGISMRTLDRMIALGDFPKPFVVGSRRMYRRASVEKWIAEAEAEAERSPRGRRR